MSLDKYSSFVSSELTLLCLSQVAPVASIVSHLPHSVPQIVINRDPIQHANFDIHLLGDGDTIVQHLCDRLAQAEAEAQAGATAAEPAPSAPPASAPGAAWDLARVPVQAKPLAVAGAGGQARGVVTPERVGDSHVWLFPGADREHRWVRAVRTAFGGADEERAKEFGTASAGVGVGASVVGDPFEAVGQLGVSQSGGRIESDEGEVTMIQHVPEMAGRFADSSESEDTRSEGWEDEREGTRRPRTEEPNGYAYAKRAKYDPWA